ncbi:uncharacterized protein JCM10292_006726 [Rhodotorula paludigena]|uniref:uncharacterized protein n=1 Tax=Rhodotorula paludigena TaxID=86838 RepID=UPI00317F624D
MSIIWDGSSSPLLARVGSTHGWLSSQTPHPAVPFSLFAIAHAIRVACVYRGIARAGGYDSQLGNLQAAIVPLVLILGGSTVSSVLLGLVPGWVVTPIPVATYGLIPLLAAKTGLVSLVLSIPSLPRESLFCLIDGFSRIMGMTTLGVDVVLSHPNQAVRNSPWAMVLVAFISGGGGGMLVPAFKLFGPSWGFTDTPAWVKNGLNIDVWSAGFIGYVYATLIDAHPFFRKPVAYLLTHLPALRGFFDVPKAYLTSPRHTVLLQPGEAKIFCSLLLASMLFTSRIVVPLLSRSSAAQQQKRKAVAGIKEAQQAVAASSTAVKGAAKTGSVRERKNQ